MKRILLLLLLFLTCSLAPCIAALWTPETLPVPANTNDPTLASYVSNPDALLSDSAVRRINHVMYNLEREKGVRGLIIAVGEIEPADPYTFTMEVARRHGVGGSANTGFVLMMATQSQAYSLLTGTGLEKFLTDAQCSQLQRTYMASFMKQQRWDPAVEMVVYKVRDVLNAQEELVPHPDDGLPPAQSGRMPTVVMDVMGYILMGIGFLLGLIIVVAMLVGLLTGGLLPAILSIFTGRDGDDHHTHHSHSGSSRGGGGSHSWGSRGGGHFGGGGASGRH